MTSVKGKAMRNKSREDVLRYRPKPVSRATVRRHYAAWRTEKGLPPRCDSKECCFNTNPLIWLGQALPLIMDHINGNNRDNNPKNLRYLCPNCDSQLSTRGGKNRGRVAEAKDGSYILLTCDGRWHQHLIPETAKIQITSYAPTISSRPAALSSAAQQTAPADASSRRG
jgi:hypothetical protein